MMVYAIQVTDLYTFRNSISKEAYDSYVKAKHFCENRADKPEKLNDYTYKSKEYKYKIIPLNLV